MIDEAISALSRLLMNRQCEVDHGPMGVGIEVMTYIADHYRPPALRAALGLFGRYNVVRRADLVIFVGGAQGTQDEIDLSVCLGKRIVPFAASGGAARHAFDRMRADASLRSWMPEATFAALGCCVSADEYAKIIEQLLSDSGSAPQ